MCSANLSDDYLLRFKISLSSAMIIYIFIALFLIVDFMWFINSNLSILQFYICPISFTFCVILRPALFCCFCFVSASLVLVHVFILVLTVPILIDCFYIMFIMDKFFKDMTVDGVDHLFKPQITL